MLTWLFRSLHLRLDAIAHYLEEIMAHLEELKEAVRLIEDRGDATITLLKGIAAKLSEIAGDEAAVRDLAARLRAQAAEFDAAITENTPTPEEPEAPPEVPEIPAT